jgi:hypothetical protein
MADWPGLRDVVAEMRERNLDVGEVMLIDAVNNGAPWAVRFFLLTQGKARGYTERTEHADVTETPDWPRVVEVIVDPPAQLLGDGREPVGEGRPETNRDVFPLPTDAPSPVTP